MTSTAPMHPRRSLAHVALAGVALLVSHDAVFLAQVGPGEALTRILRSAGLVQANENGPRVSYCIVPSALQRLKALLEAV